MLPVKAHVNENDLTEAGVDQYRQVFALKVVRWNAPKFVTCERNQAQVWQLFYYLEVLVPAVKLVLVKVQVNSSRNELTNLIELPHV